MLKSAGLKSAGVGALCVAAVFAASARIGELSNGDKAFMKSAAVNDMTEAHLGKRAQEQTSNVSIKTFGETLVKDHTRAYEELTMLANKTGESIPKGIDIRRIRSIEELAHTNGSSFDRRFVTDEVQDHRRAIAEFRREAERGKNADVKAYAQKMIPTLEEHLREAKELETSGGHRVSSSTDRRKH